MANRRQLPEVREWNVESRTAKGRYYLVTMNDRGEIACECPGYTFREKCWHVKRVEEMLKEGSGHS